MACAGRNEVGTHDDDDDDGGGKPPGSNTYRLRVFKDRFVVIKVLTRAVTDDKSATSELAISECIARAGKRHEGLRYVRTMIESFKVQGPSGEHTCLVYTTMRETLSTFQRRIQDQRVPSDVLKVLLKILLTGLDFLHRRCHVIHTGECSRHSLLCSTCTF